MARNALRMIVLSVALGLLGCQTTSNQSEKNSPEEKAKLAQINTQLGLAYMRDGENELALKKLQKALKVNPKDPDAHNAMGLLHARLGEVKEAEESFKTAIELDPKNSLAFNNYGQFLCQLKRYKDGQEKFLAAVKNPLYKTPEIAYSNAGICALKADDKEAAENYFRAALQVNPKMASALLQMAAISYDLGRYLPAKAYLQRYAEVGEPTPKSLWLGIRVEHKLGDENAVSSYALQLKNKFPDSAETGLLLQGQLE